MPDSLGVCYSRVPNKRNPTNKYRPLISIAPGIVCKIDEHSPLLSPTKKGSFKSIRHGNIYPLF